MTEENKPVVEQTDVKKVELPADYIEWKRKADIDAKLNEMISKDPKFKDIVDAGLRETLHEIPQILEIPKLFEKTVSDFAKQVVDKARAQEQKQETRPETDTKPEVKQNGPAAERPVVYNVSEGFDPKKHYCPAMESEDSLRKKGFSEVGIAMVKTFG